MHPIVAAADAAHFLSLVPSLLGFTPARSLVVVPFGGSRSLGALRVDLPPEGADLDAVSSRVLGMVCRIDGADGLAAVVYTDEGTGDGLPGARVVAAISHAADVCGIRIVDALTVAADGWGSHLDRACPASGRSLDEIRSRTGAPTHDQGAGARLPRHPSRERKEVATAVGRLEAALEVACGLPRLAGSPVDPQALAEACRLDDLPALYEETVAADAASLTPLRVALLAWCFSRPSLRDIALVQWATDRVGGDDAAEAQRRWEGGEDYPPHLGMVMWGEGPRPLPSRIADALEVVRHVAALAPRAMRPGALALCGWLSWALGRSTHAHEYSRWALEIDPRHGLAEILQSFVQIGHLPDWAFTRPDGDVR